MLRYNDRKERGMKKITILISLLLFPAWATSESFNPKGQYSGPLALVDIGSIGGYPCGGTVGEVSNSGFKVSFRNGVVSAPYYNEVMKGSVLPGRGFKIKKTFLYAGAHPETVTLLARNVTSSSADMTFTNRLITNTSPQQGCLWTYKGKMTRTR